MKAFDLTTGKYLFYDTPALEASVTKCLEEAKLPMMLRVYFPNDIPVFLVESQQSHSYVPIVGSQSAVLVPDSHVESADSPEWDDSLNSRLHIWDLKDWSEMLPSEEEPKEKKPKDEEPQKIVTSIIDILGIYISDNDPLIPKRIFIWVDKVYSCANGDDDNAKALLLQVVLHELAHAFLDVRVKASHNPIFTYKHPAYRFIEEGLANAISLHLCMGHFSQAQQTFISQFVSNQGIGYSDGGLIYTSFPIFRAFKVGEVWRWAKGAFNKEIAGSIFRALFDTTNASWFQKIGRELLHIQSETFHAERKQRQTISAKALQEALDSME